jgi:hypothetical protein
MYKYKALKRDRKRIDEHRFIMEILLGRKLSSSEVVHHIDGNGRNNDIKNLQVMSLYEHSKFHLKGKKPNITHEQLIISGRKNLPAAKLKSSDIPMIHKIRWAWVG